MMNMSQTAAQLNKETQENKLMCGALSVYTIAALNIYWKTLLLKLLIVIKKM